MYLLRMPKADENMGEGTVARWLLEEGAEVASGQDLVECVADKGEFMVYAEEGGTLRRIYAAEQSVVPVGYVLAAVGRADEELPDVDSENAALIVRSREELTASAGLTAPAHERVRATPAARRASKELGVSLGRVAASVGGKLVREGDVRAFAERGNDIQQGCTGHTG